MAHLSLFNWIHICTFSIIIFSVFKKYLNFEALFSTTNGTKRAHGKESLAGARAVEVHGNEEVSEEPGDRERDEPVN